MEKLKTMLKTIYSNEAIIELKNSKLIMSLIVLFFLSLLLNFGVGISFIRLDQIDPTLLNNDIYDNIDSEFPQNLPDCEINEDSQLFCRTDEVFIQSISDYIVIVDVNNQFTDYKEDKLHIVFEKENIKIIGGKEQNGDDVLYTLSYHSFKGVSFKDYQTQSQKEVIDDVVNRIFVGIKPFILLPALLMIYFVVVFMNFLFVFGLALMGLLTRYGNRKELSYKQSLNYAIYSSLLPVLVTFIFAVFLSPIFGVVIYNFFLAIRFILVLRRHGKVKST